MTDIPKAPDESQIDPTLQDALSHLQDEMALIDMLRRPSRSDALELMLKKHEHLVLKMDGNLNHARAHLHIDYHREKHFASYAIDNGELLAGRDNYSRAVKPWIRDHKDALMRVWIGIRGSGADLVTVAELQASSI